MTIYEGMLLGAVSLSFAVQLFIAFHLFRYRPAQLTIYSRDSDLPASGHNPNGAELPLGYPCEQAPAAVFDHKAFPRSEAARHTRPLPIFTEGGNAASLVTSKNETDINNRDRILAQIDHLDGVIRAGTVSIQKLREAYSHPHSIPPNQPVSIEDTERQTHRSDNQSGQSQPIHNKTSCSCQDGAACSRD